MLSNEFRRPIQRMYSNLDYYKFCEYMGLNPKYDMEYWNEFQKLSSALAAFDNAQLQKIIDYSNSAQ